MDFQGSWVLPSLLTSFWWTPGSLQRFYVGLHVIYHVALIHCHFCIDPRSVYCSVRVELNEVFVSGGTDHHSSQQGGARGEIRRWLTNFVIAAFRKHKPEVWETAGVPSNLKWILILLIWMVTLSVLHHGCNNTGDRNACLLHARPLNLPIK